MTEKERGLKFCPRCAEPLISRELSGRGRLSCPSAECGYVFWDNPIPVVAALVEHGEHVLLVRNRGWPQGWYGLVAGFLEREEDPEEGALREVREELNLEGEIVSLIGLYSFPQKNEIIMAYHVRAHGEIRLGEELEDFKLIRPGKLRPWPFGTGLAVRDWLKTRESSA
jgi:NADH pyrophosphatase NudC (nudix superfamily)